MSDNWKWLVRMGLNEDWLRRKVHTRESGLAHYAKACTDLEFNFPFGFQVDLSDFKVLNPIPLVGINGCISKRLI